MRKMFIGYYRPTNEEFKHLWDTALIVLDTNVLLNLYRYTRGTRDELIQILNRLQDRLWLPHQAAYEFHNNRLKVISDATKDYEKLQDELDTWLKRLEAIANSRRHPVLLDPSAVKNAMSSLEGLKKEIQNSKSKHLGFFDGDIFKDDIVLDAVTRLFDGRVGQPYDATDHKSICEVVERRVEASTPPGYMDAKKDGNRKLGDGILWLQTVEKAKVAKSPIILVTGETKEDWWQKVGGKTVGPRPELIKEMMDEAQAGFYMYSVDQFMEYAKKHLGAEVTEATLQEVREVKKEQTAPEHAPGFLFRPQSSGDRFSPASMERFYRIVRAHPDLFTEEEFRDIENSWDRLRQINARIDHVEEVLEDLGLAQQRASTEDKATIDRRAQIRLEAERLREFRSYEHHRFERMLHEVTNKAIQRRSKSPPDDEGSVT